MTAAPFYQNTYPANGAIDGIIPDVINTHCAHLSNADGVPVEWWTDLGNVYKIYNITIYARKDGRYYIIYTCYLFNWQLCDVNTFSCVDTVCNKINKL